MRSTRLLLMDHAAVAMALPTRFTHLLIALATFCVFAPTASAAPRIIEEQARLALPGGSSQRVIVDMALYGGRLVLLTTPSPVSTTREVWLYERTSLETWSPPTLIMSVDGPFHPQPGHVAIYSSTIALTFRNRLVIAQVNGNQWEVTADLTTPTGVGEMGSDVEISCCQVVVGGENGTNFQALMFRQGAGGVWAYSRQQRPGITAQAGERRHLRADDCDASDQQRNDLHAAAGGHRHGAARLRERPSADGGSRYVAHERQVRSRDLSRDGDFRRSAGAAALSVAVATTSVFANCRSSRLSLA